MSSTELNNLFHMLVDSQKGYSEAAEIAELPQIAAMFADRARSRQQLVERFTATWPEMVTERDEGTLGGAAHRLFINLRRMVQDDTKVALAEVERGETTFLEAIEGALDDSDLVGAERHLVSELHEEVLADRDELAETTATY